FELCFCGGARNRPHRNQMALRILDCEIDVDGRPPIEDEGKSMEVARCIEAVPIVVAPQHDLPLDGALESQGLRAFPTAVLADLRNGRCWRLRQPFEDRIPIEV